MKSQKEKSFAYKRLKFELYLQFPFVVVILHDGLFYQSQKIKLFLMLIIVS